MVTSLSKIKCRIWRLIIFLLALSFALQVYFNSPIPALFPYGLFLLVIILQTQSSKRLSVNRISSNQSPAAGQMVGVYLFLFILNTGWQTCFGFVSINEGVSVFVIFFMPVLWYWYFLKIGSEREIRSILWGLFFAGFCVGMCFTYDSILKLAFNQISDFSIRAHEYSVSRAGGIEADVSNTRIKTAYRGFGIMVTHSVSGAWICIGAFAALAMIPTKRIGFRRLSVLVFGVMLLLGLNFTSIIAFAVIMFLIEFDGISLMQFRIQANGIIKLVSLFLVFLMILVIGFMLAGDTMGNFVLWNLTFQSNLLLGSGDADISFITITVRNIYGYFEHIGNYPLSLLIGDGFTRTYGLTKGGDIGWVESAARFGLPFFSAIVLGILALIRSSLEQIRFARRSRKPGAPDSDIKLRIFAVQMLLLILITEGHYSVWSAKSILPIVFFTLVLHRRFPLTTKTT